MTAPNPRVPILSALRTIDAHGPWAIEKLCERTPEKVVLSKFEDLVTRGYLDYGVSLRYPWLTPKGREYLDSAGG